MRMGGDMSGLMREIGLFPIFGLCPIQISSRRCRPQTVVGVAICPKLHFYSF